jgi:hypothetical protein
MEAATTWQSSITSAVYPNVQSRLELFQAQVGVSTLRTASAKEKLILDGFLLLGEDEAVQ